MSDSTCVDETEVEGVGLLLVVDDGVAVGEATERSLDRGRHEVDRHDLRVWVRDRPACRTPLVDEHLDVRMTVVRERAGACTQHLEHLDRFAVAERTERAVMVGRQRHRNSPRLPSRAIVCDHAHDGRPVALTGGAGGSR